jgi:hypothetical protein
MQYPARDLDRQPHDVGLRPPNYLAPRSGDAGCGGGKFFDHLADFVLAALPAGSFALLETAFPAGFVSLPDLLLDGGADFLSARSCRRRGFGST